MEGPSNALTLQEALSGIFGSISLAIQLLLLVPQLILNYKNQRADGISLTFLCVWMIGDLANLSGAVWATLIPIVILQAIYFCISDAVLISQCIYYRYICDREIPNSPSSDIETTVEETPLLGAHQPPMNASSQQILSQKTADNEKKSNRDTWTNNTLSILGVILVGTAGWAIAYSTAIWTPMPAESSLPNNNKSTPIGAELLGYVSALCYLSARIPQIVKNHREKSCKGLSLLFFILSLTGNATYGASILSHSLKKDYLLTNLPWLIGSLGTMAEDVIIFLQFHLYVNDHVSKGELDEMTS